MKGYQKGEKLISQGQIKIHRSFDHGYQPSGVTQNIGGRENMSAEID